MIGPTKTTEVPVSLEEPSWSSKSCGGHSERLHADRLQLAQSLRAAQTEDPQGRSPVPACMDVAQSWAGEFRGR